MLSTAGKKLETIPTTDHLNSSLESDLALGQQSYPRRFTGSTCSLRRKLRVDIWVQGKQHNAERSTSRNVFG